MALGGARTLGKLDESSTGGVIGIQSLAYDALFSLCTQKLLSLYGPKEDMSVHSNQRQRSLDMHCLFVYLRIPCLSVLSVWRRYGPRTWKLLWKKDMRLAAVTELVPINTNISQETPEALLFRFPRPCGGVRGTPISTLSAKRCVFATFREAYGVRNAPRRP